MHGQSAMNPSDTVSAVVMVTTVMMTSVFFGVRIGVMAGKSGAD